MQREGVATTVTLFSGEGEGSSHNKYLCKVRGALSRSHIRNLPLNAFLHQPWNIHALCKVFMWNSVQVSPRGESAEETEGIQHIQKTTSSVVLMLLAYRTLEGTLMTCPVKTNNSLGPVWSDNVPAFDCSYILWLACIHLGKLTEKIQETLHWLDSVIKRKKILNALYCLHLLYAHNKWKYLWKGKNELFFLVTRGL